jgi:hypothetical protein
MKSKWVDFEGKRILYMDLSDFKDNMRSFEEELNQAVGTIGQEMYQQPPHSVLVLVDLRNTPLTQVANRMLSERIADTKKYVAKTTVLGMTGIRKAFLEHFARVAASDTNSFDDVESAMKWLVKA